MILAKGKYITNTSSKPLPILLAGKVDPFAYLQPGETYPLLIDEVRTRQDGLIYAVRSRDMAKPVYIVIGQVQPDGTELSFVEAITSAEYKNKLVKAEEDKQPIGTFTLLKYALLVAVAAYAYKSFFKK